MVMDVLASILCKYDLRKGDLFVLSWARVRRVMWESITSELLMCGGGVRIHHRPLQSLSHDMSDSGDMEVFINHPIFRISLLCPAAKVVGSLILPTIIADMPRQTEPVKRV